MKKGPDVTLVVEADNLQSAGSEQARSMFGALASEVGSIGLTIEALVLYDRSSVDPEALSGMMDAAGLEQLQNATVELHPTEGLRYYELKNEGVRRSKGEIVAFTDSDVSLHPGWLSALLRPLSDSNFKIVVGSTFVGPIRSLYDKAFALFWNFPLRQADGPPYRRQHLYVNNWAGRRATLARYPFPSDGRYRGQCATLARQMTADGIEIWHQPLARVAHPPPKGFMFRRALWRGHDLYLAARQTGDARRYGIVGSLHALASLMKQSTRRIVAGRRAVGLSWLEVPAALGIAAAYQATAWLGFVLTRVHPSTLHRIPLAQL